MVVVSSADSPSDSQDQPLLTRFASRLVVLSAVLCRGQLDLRFVLPGPTLANPFARYCDAMFLLCCYRLCRHLSSRSLVVLRHSPVMRVRIRGATGKEMACENAVPVQFTARGSCWCSVVVSEGGHHCTDRADVSCRKSPAFT